VSSDGPGRGSEFVVSLPCIAPAPAATRPVAPAGPLADGHRRILIVEDNPDACHMLRLALELAGHAVQVAEDGERALDLAATRWPEVVVIDIGLPGMDGYELARQLRASSACRGMHLLALTGYGQAQDRQRSLDVGFVAHLVKPVDPEELARVITALSPDPAPGPGWPISISAESRPAGSGLREDRPVLTHSESGRWSGRNGGPENGRGPSAGVTGPRGAGSMATAAAVQPGPQIAALRASNAPLQAQLDILGRRLFESEQRRRALLRTLDNLTGLERRLANQRKAALDILVDCENHRRRLARQAEQLEKARS
jgi:CheY-like chemotaxis protein